MKTIILLIVLSLSVSMTKAFTVRMHDSIPPNLNSIQQHYYEKFQKQKKLSNGLIIAGATIASIGGIIAMGYTFSDGFRHSNSYNPPPKSDGAAIGSVFAISGGAVFLVGVAFKIMSLENKKKATLDISNQSTGLNNIFTQPINVPSVGVKISL